MDAEQADSAIKRDTRPVADTVFKFALQEIVHADEDVADVAEEVAYAIADFDRHHAHVPARHRPGDRLIDRVVEAVDAAVQRLERMARIAVAGARATGGHADQRREGQPRHHLAGSFASGLPWAALLNRNW